MHGPRPFPRDPRAGGGTQGTTHREGLRPPTGEGTTSLLARAGYATVDAGVLALAGSSGQKACIVAFADDFFVSVHVSSSPTPTAV